MTPLLTLAFHVGRFVEAWRAMWAPLPPAQPWEYRVRTAFGVVDIDKNYRVLVTEEP